MSKPCFKCGETKPLDEFYAHAAMGDGHLNKCKDCAKRDVRTRRILNPEKVREYDRERGRKPERVAQRVAYGRTYKEASPEKRAAHTVVGNAVRSGKLKKLPCAFCGSSDRLEAHHHDYAKPLDVTWLCSACHSRFHALERMAAYDREEAA